MDDYETFCEANWDRLVSGLAHQFGDLSLAEDLAQEALIRAGAQWERMASVAAPLAWVFRVAANLGKSEMRRRAAETRALDRLAAPVASAEQSSTDVADALRRAMARLTDTQRRVLIARFFLDLDVTEVANGFKMSQGAVRAASHRGVQQLRADLPFVVSFSEE